MTDRTVYRLHSRMFPLSAGWESAIERYLIAQRSAGHPDTTIVARRQHLANLAAHIAVSDPWQLTGEQLVEWVGTREWKPETRRSRRSTFRSFYRWARHEKLTKQNPAAALERVPASYPNPHPCPRDVFERALHRATPRVALMLRLAGEHGLRRGEIALVHSRDLFQDLDGWSLRVHGKGRRDADQTLNSRTALELRSLPEGFAFPGAIDGHLSPRRVGELLDDALDGDWTGHSLRHMAGQGVYDLTGDLGLTQDFLRHANPNTTRHYVKPRRDRLRAVTDQLAS